MSTPSKRAEVAIGRVFDTPVGQAIRYSVREAATYFGPLPTRTYAVALARHRAIAETLRVLDVNSATEQQDGSWIVELAVEEKP